MQFHFHPLSDIFDIRGLEAYIMEKWKMYNAAAKKKLKSKKFCSSVVLNFILADVGIRSGEVAGRPCSYVHSMPFPRKPNETVSALG